MAKAKELTVHIPVGDWQDEYLRAEVDVSSRDKIPERLAEGHTTAELGRFAIVARERGEAAEDVLAPNKLLLHSGTMREVSAIGMQQMTEYELPDGRVIKVRALVGTVPVADVDAEPEGDAEQLEFVAPALEDPALADDKPGFVSYTDPLAVQRTIRYLRERVPGYVYNRFKILAANKADVRGEAQALVDTIWEMVARLE